MQKIESSVKSAKDVVMEWMHAVERRDSVFFLIPWMKAVSNISNQTLNFNEGGYYSVTVSAHGTAIQHMSAPMS